MTHKRLWLALGAWVCGCAAPSAVSTPKAHADGTALRFEHWCLDVEGVPKPTVLDQASAEGWELVSATFRPPVVAKGDSVGGGATLLCFKRPH